MAKKLTAGDQYRKRAGDIGKRLKSRTTKEQAPMMKKKKALNDMADNEDWLDGKRKS
jgi:hypothetical protein